MLRDTASVIKEIIEIGDIRTAGITDPAFKWPLAHPEPLLYDVLHHLAAQMPKGHRIADQLWRLVSGSIYFGSLPRHQQLQALDAKSLPPTKDMWCPDCSERGLYWNEHDKTLTNASTMASITLAKQPVKILSRLLLANEAVSVADLADHLARGDDEAVAQQFSNKKNVEVAVSSLRDKLEEIGVTITHGDYALVPYQEGTSKKMAEAAISDLRKHLQERGVNVN